MRFRETVYEWRKTEGGGGAVEKWENCLNEVVITSFLRVRAISNSRERDFHITNQPTENNDIIPRLLTAP